MKKIINIKTNFGNFDCIFESNDPDAGYTVIVQKLKGIVSFGKNLTEAKKMIKEAIELHCECLLQKGLAELKIIRQTKTKNIVCA